MKQNINDKNRMASKKKEDNQGVENMKKWLDQYGILRNRENKDLRRCPFCGSSPKYKKCFPMDNLHTVMCLKKTCGINPSAIGESKKEAVDKWNHRIGG